MRIWAGLVVFAVAMVALAACTFDDGDELDLSADEAGLEIDNGNNLNGNNLNGNNLNGNNLNGSELGRYVKYVRYRDAQLDGANLKDVYLDGSELVARRHHHVVRGVALTGARLSAKSDTGKQLVLRIAGVTPPATGDTWRYDVQYRETDGSWQPICLDGTTPYDAVAIDGWWDLRSGHPGDGSKHASGQRFTFACRHVGALGKCIDAGYRPWASHAGASLDEYHQACVRLIRADYCGDSVSHTIDGQLVNLYDQLGVQSDTSPWTPEAEWSADGALCISPHTRSIDAISCADEILDEDCATGFGAGTLVISEFPSDD